MGRKPSEGLPSCPDSAHECFRVSKDGTYGKRARQRYRCTDPTTGEFHRFVPELPRLVVASGTCDTCDNHVHTHQGPVALPGGLYEVREVAQALVLLAQGQTYTETARIIRGRYWGVGGTGRRADSSVENGQTVADWLDQFGPVIAAGTTETEWPESIVVDSTEFQHTNPKTGRAEQLFCVLAAWGYPAGSKTGRLWALRAYPSDTADEWVDFLRSLPGRPKSVISDADQAIRSAMRVAWGGRGPAHHLCEHHLYRRGLKAVREDGVRYDDGRALGPLLAEAFTSPQAWAAFYVEATSGHYPTAARWARHWNKRMKTQTGRRASLPAHYATGAIEPKLATVRQMLERRRWTFRNRRRMNTLLELVRQRLNRTDDVARWASLIRADLEAGGGKPSHPRRRADPVTFDAAGERVYSLRG